MKPEQTEINYTPLIIREITTGKKASLSPEHKKIIDRDGFIPLAHDGIGAWDMMYERIQYNPEQLADLSHARWESSRIKVSNREQMGQKRRGMFIAPTACFYVPLEIYQHEGKEYQRTRVVISEAMNEIIIGNYAAKDIISNKLAQEGNDIYALETRFNKVPGLLDQQDLEQLKNVEFVCITATSFEEPAILRLVWQIRSCAPDVPIIIGGWGPSTETHQKFDNARHIVPKKYETEYLQTGLADLVLLGDGIESLHQAIEELTTTKNMGKRANHILNEAHAANKFAGGAVLLDEQNRIEKIGQMQQKTHRVGTKIVLKDMPLPVDLKLGGEACGTVYHKYDRSKFPDTLADNITAQRGLRLMEKQYGKAAADVLRYLFQCLGARNWTDIPLEEGCQFLCNFCIEPFVNGRGAIHELDRRMKIYEQWGEWIKDRHYLTGNSGRLKKLLDILHIPLNELSPLTMIFLSGDNLIANKLEFMLMALEKYAYFDGGREKSPGLCGQFTTCRMKPELVPADTVQDDKHYYIKLDKEEAEIMQKEARLMGKTNDLVQDRKKWLVKVSKSVYDLGRLQGAMMSRTVADYRAAAFGFESGDPEALAGYNKGTEVLDALISMRALRAGATVKEILAMIPRIRKASGGNPLLDKAEEMFKKLNPNKRIKWHGLIQAFTIVSANNKEDDRATERLINHFNAVAQRIALQPVNHFAPGEVLDHVAQAHDPALEWFKQTVAALGLDGATIEQGSEAHLLSTLNQHLHNKWEHEQQAVYGPRPLEPDNHLYNLTTEEWIQLLQNPEVAIEFAGFLARVTNSLKRLNNIPQTLRIFARAAMKGDSIWAATSRLWSALIYLPLRQYQQDMVYDALHQDIYYSRKQGGAFIPMRKLDILENAAI